MSRAGALCVRSAATGDANAQNALPSVASSAWVRGRDASRRLSALRLLAVRPARTVKTRARLLCGGGPGCPHTGGVDGGFGFKSWDI